MDDQDWTLVTLKRKSKTKVTSSVPVVSAASQQVRRVESQETGKLKTLTLKSRGDMAQARMTKNLTQKQLDQQCQFPANSCNLWELGKACPSGPQLNILHRVLGIKLERS